MNPRNSARVCDNEDALNQDVTSGKRKKVLLKKSCLKGKRGIFLDDLVLTWRLIFKNLSENAEFAKPTPVLRRF